MGINLKSVKLRSNMSFRATALRTTGGDPGIKQAMKYLWEELGDALAAKFGAKYDSRAIWGYIETAIQLAEGATGMKCTEPKLLALGAPQVRSVILAGVAQYILEGEVMDLPEKFPVPEGLTRPFTMRAHAKALAKSMDSVGSETDNPKSPIAIMVRSTGGDPKDLAAVVRGAVAEQVPVEPLRNVKVPVLVLNGKADLANQSVARLLEVIPNARSAVVPGEGQSGDAARSVMGSSSREEFLQSQARLFYQMPRH